MLSKEEAERLASQINVACREQVRPFVALRTHLPPAEFEAEASAYLDHVEAASRERLGSNFDDLDALLMQGYRRAMHHEYKRLRAAGASLAGHG